MADPGTTVINGCTLNGGILSNKTIAPLTFRKVSPEIREMIFQRCVDFSGKTPALLVALRGDQELYHEASRLYYKLNRFALRKKNWNDFKVMSDVALGQLSYLELSSDRMSGRLFEDLVSVCWSKMPNVRYGRLECLSHIYYLWDTAIRRLEAVVAQYHQDLVDNAWYYAPSNAVLNRVDTHLGIRRKLENVNTGSKPDVWFWQAEEGQKLTWT